ncbi:MAG: 30S ribosomal protein S6 [Rhodospirillales bacterium]|jgi:small subunit ribosomal protein S6|nr:30S ribosomal protein S6 [Rhodospirillales bacterium]MBT4038910.1 30S ribosomal protein S6 [Rhodospirillales bacterium]MBT4625245.1 30S ribosomal protein S6 [Rhodospirillales bacterium]MBT5351008.1 30S ribosomal protein S6 [Rhodospirillales bacterium]MBT5521272.1 30S ribosomal protein S6 [Rhodospirillales bacterium]
MAFYESVFIARQDIAAPQVETLTENITKIIEDEGGSVLKTEHWGLRSLAYRIKKNRKGHYVLLNVDSPASAIAEMERQMRINEDVLRYMTIRVDELEEGPSAIMRNRGSEDRPRRPRSDEDGDNSTPAPADAGDAPAKEAVTENAPVEEIAAEEVVAEEAPAADDSDETATDKGDA